MKSFILFLMLFTSAALSAELDPIDIIPSVPSSTPTTALGGFNTGSPLATTNIISQLGLPLHDLTGVGNQLLVSMRGFGANAASNQLILLDGIPLTNPDLAPIDLFSLPSASIENIEVIEGSENVRYGDQAVGGLILLHSQKISNKKQELQFDLGSYTNTYAAYHVAQVSERLQQQINFSVNQSHHYRAHNDSAVAILNGLIDLETNEQTLHFNYLFNFEDYQYPGALTHLQVRENRRQASNESDFFKNINANFFSEWRSSLFESYFSTMQFSLRNMFGKGVLTSQFNQNRHQLYLDELVETFPLKQHVMTGFNVSLDDYALHTFFGDTQQLFKKASIFILDQIDLAQNWQMKLGTRIATQNQQYANATELRCQWQPNKAFPISAKIASNYRFPKADELDPVGRTDPLQVQTGISYELNAAYKNKRLQPSLSLYFLDLRHEIAYDPMPNPSHPFGSNQNLAPTSRRGAVAKLNYHLAHSDFDASYQYVRAAFISGPYAGRRIPLVASNFVQIAWYQSIWETLSIGLTGTFTGKEYAANDYANVSGVLGGYSILSTVVRYYNKFLEISLVVNNLLNKQYYSYTVFQPDMNETFFYPAPLRNFIFTVKLNFA